MRTSRFPWHLILGLLLGAALGLLYAWVISPVEYVDTTPDSLSATFKDDFRIAIARAYLATGNLDRAKVRLSLLRDENPSEALSAQAQRVLASGGNANNIRALAQLATDLQNPPSLQTVDTEVPQIVASSTPGSITGAIQTATLTPRSTRTAIPAATNTPIYTLTPRPTLTATPTIGAPFLADQLPICDPAIPDGLLRVTVLDAVGTPIPGAALIISWESGEETFYTGFKPEISDGYADYVMQANVTYSLRLSVPSASVENLTPPACRTDDGTPYWGSIEITFQQP